MLSFKNLVLLAAFVVCCVARQPKIGIFNVVKFPNDACQGSGTMNGTCYTEEECSDKKGTAAGSCAEGFGVCCVISLNCGETSGDNTTYLELASTSTPGSGCTYTICPSSSDVNRIRLDFTTFMIADPGTLATPAVTLGTGNVDVGLEATIGHCTTDSFAATGTPVICGNNEGQHMYLDTDGTACVQAVFAYGGDSSERKYKIQVTQYDRKNDMGGPTGCLQYFTTDKGTFKSFNFQDDAVASATASSINIGSPHLANQDYSVCIRQNADKCAICYSATKTFASQTVTNSFGLSVTDTAATTIENAAVTGSVCATDYIYIPNGLATSTTPPAGQTLTLLSPVDAKDSVGRYCGRFLGFAGEDESQTVCSKSTPFTVGVLFDGTEALTSAAAATADTSIDESIILIGTDNVGAAGTYGFSLGFTQLSCS